MADITEIEKLWAFAMSLDQQVRNLETIVKGQRAELDILFERAYPPPRPRPEPGEGNIVLLYPGGEPGGAA